MKLTKSSMLIVTVEKKMLGTVLHSSETVQ